MTDRHTVNTITSDALDALYESLEAAQDTELHRQLRTADAAFASATVRAAQLEAQLAEVRALHERWVKAGPPLGQQISRWWDRRLVELAAALATPPADGTRATRHVHVTITNPDADTANRAALSLADWIADRFPGHHVTTDAREREQPGPAATQATEPATKEN